MKIKDGFILSSVAGQDVVVAVGKRAKQFVLENNTLEKLVDKYEKLLLK